MSIAESPQQEQIVVREVVEPPVSTRRRVATGSLLVVAGLLAVLAFGVGADKGSAVFGLNAASDTPFDVTVPAGLTAGLLGLVVVALGVYQLVRGFPRRQTRWVVAGALARWWWRSCAGRRARDQRLQITGLLQQSILSAVPLVLGALGGILCERSGVINVAIEGQMLSGAFAGALFASVAHNLGVGVLAAVLAGGLVGALLAVFAIRYLVNQVILGVVINLLALGLTGFIYDALMQPHADKLNNPGVFCRGAIPVLGDIPVFGPRAVPRERPRLPDVRARRRRRRGVVPDPMGAAHPRRRRASEGGRHGRHQGVADPLRRHRARRLRGRLGGRVPDPGRRRRFRQEHDIGARASSRSPPSSSVAGTRAGAVGAALLFGFADALQTGLTIIQAPVQIPSNFLAMAPYLATLFVVAGLGGRVRAPAADGEPYVK